MTEAEIRKIEEAKSAFSWLAAELRFGREPEKLSKYARVNANLLADLLDDIRDKEA